MNYDQALKYLQTLPDMETGNHQTRLPNMTLGSMMALLEKLDNPQLNRTTIHITGSKGKGSTAYFLANILKTAKLKTALFTSPHLSSYLERFQIDLQPISPQLFADTLSEIKPLLDIEMAKNDRSLSTFGVLILMFFQMVKNVSPKIDCQIIEVGIGGRYDATNVFNTKDIAIITPISLEHTEILGNTITEIASNKAGIITKNCSAVLAPQKDSAVATVISRKCYEVGADFIELGKKYKIVSVASNINSQSFQIVPTKPRDAAPEFEFELSMNGIHQQVNASTAALAAVALQKKGLPITLEQIHTGLKNTSVPGRFEILEYINLNQEKFTLILDGAHNQDSSKCLAQTLKSCYPNTKFTFVIGINNDKNIHAIWNELVNLAQNVVITRSKNARAFSTKTIKEVVSFYGLSEENIICKESTSEAFEAALASSTNQMICVCGSLYVVGEIRELIKPNFHE